VIVAQRLKRMNRILGKLQRMPGTKIARMEDIGGCRAVLANPAELDAVLRRIRRRWDVVRDRDYWRSSSRSAVTGSRNQSPQRATAGTSLGGGYLGGSGLDRVTLLCCRIRAGLTVHRL
jgi:hypothetical protein